jgi:anti-sigma factor RsiW
MTHETMTSRRRRDRPSERDLAALADGSLSPARREGVERAVAASPELEAAVHDQRLALAAVRDAATPSAPAALRARLERTRPSARPARRARALAIAGGAATAAALVITLGGSPGGPPTVTGAALLSTRAAVAPVPARARGTTLAFPDWSGRSGWKAIGARHDTLAGRQVTTAFYRRGRAVVAYSIVAGAPAALGSPARASTYRGRAFSSFTAQGRRVVTWVRGGHTCVISGARTDTAVLRRLATV